MSGLRLRLFSFPTAAFITMLIFGLAGAASAWFVPRESATASGGRSWTIESGATNSALTSAGALSVSERFNVNFDGTFRGFYRDVPGRVSPWRQR